MPVKNDAEKRWVELEFVLPGTPEQLWHAMATGPGISAWFTTTTVEERVGGTIAFDFGGGAVSQGTITGWQPPARLTYEEHEWSSGAPPVATEITIRSRSGDACVVRLVHSLFTSEDTWDDELEGFEAGWPGFFEVLRAYLQHFAGQKAVSFRVSGSERGTHHEAWRHVSEALGVSGPNIGEQRAAPADAPTLAGTVERVQQGAKTCEVMLRLDRPAPGIAEIGTYTYAGKARFAVSFFLYGDRAAEAAAEIEPQWRAWMARRFPDADATQS
ncbi:SRPBCC domain-containing protein [Nannocystis sp. SCPEA4]|uniref:SRPBCC family protein n=1 Tax=Nannocystis sp. SCPEA4 TaxID=2996787 RepID=UPI00226F90DF|nr:SRPBCC domain-containing protein [Nannocystis sp. SCPEA4]MCY1058240.1 SRPBCC domain-containing protein [Nannocystis sp. SCPEA4]